MDYSSYISLAIYFVVMLAIGLFAYRNSTDDISGYILGGRQVSLRSRRCRPALPI